MVPCLPRPAVEFRYPHREGDPADRVLGRAVVESDRRDLSYLSLPRVDFSGEAMRGLDLSGCDLTSAKFAGSDLRSVKFAGANLTGADFTGATLDGCDLSDVTLQDASFGKAKLDDCSLKGASMTRTGLREAALVDVDLTRAAMYDVDLADASFRKCRFHQALLSATVASRTSFFDCRLDGMKLRDVTFDDATLEWDIREGILPTLGMTFDRVTMVGGAVVGLQVNGGAFRKVTLTGTEMADVHLDTPRVDSLRISGGVLTRLSTEAGDLVGFVIHDAALHAVEFRRSRLDLRIAMCPVVTDLSFVGSSGTVAMPGCVVTGIDLTDATVRFDDMLGTTLADVVRGDAETLSMVVAMPGP